MANIEAYKNSNWVEGKSGNENGRPPKEFSMTNALKELLSEHNPETKIERYKELLNKALTMAMRGDGDMLKYLINRIEGMPQGTNDTNINVVIPIFGGHSIKEALVQSNDSNPSDIQPKEKN